MSRNLIPLMLASKWARSSKVFILVLCFAKALLLAASLAPGCIYGEGGLACRSFGRILCRRTGGAEVGVESDLFHSWILHVLRSERCVQLWRRKASSIIRENFEKLLHIDLRRDKKSLRSLEDVAPKGQSGHALLHNTFCQFSGLSLDTVWESPGHVDPRLSVETDTR